MIYNNGNPCWPMKDGNVVSIYNNGDLVAGPETDASKNYAKTVANNAYLMNVDSIGGHSIVWNLMLNPREDTAIYSGITAEKIDNKIHLYGTATAMTWPETHLRIHKNIQGHKYFVRNKVSGDYSLLTLQKFVIKPFGESSNSLTNDYMLDFNSSKIITETITLTDKTYGYIKFSNGDTADITIQADMFDLTLMFGADNEPTAEQFEAMFPAEYYEYSAPTIASANVISADITKNDTFKKSIAVPDAVRALPGYGLSAGDVYNEVDYANKKYILRIQNVNLGTLNWEYVSDYLYFRSTSLTSSIKMSNNILYEKYITSDFNIGQLYIKDKTISTNTIKHIRIKDTDYTDVETFKSSIYNTYLYYELASPIETDISDLLSDEMYDIPIEPSSTITFKQSDNTKHLPVPNQELFLVGG